MGTESNNLTRIVTLRSKKYLIKVSGHYQTLGVNAYGIAVVRERNTWQTKATRDGSITGIALNQGIIGDPYFFFVVPEKKVILGFTTGPSGSLKSVAKSTLEQFNSIRTRTIEINLIPKEKEYSSLNDIPKYNSLYFKINSSFLVDVTDDAPKLIKDLSLAPYIENNMQLAFDLDFKNENSPSLSKDSIVELVSYLSDNEGCTLLRVKGINNEGKNFNLEFSNAFLNYKTEINTRNKFVDENNSIRVLDEALVNYLTSSSIQ
ncbi:hypothetical protein ABK905_22350 [Acerihabitans sp. KWT182]|uniref:Uncharacterized protein n=1 Tax=Acerihabitans sp. KWT182 TaxID=3157919 RepID=A0AAU7Q8D2_9GAMM